jgi:hypothetical protein
MILTKLLKNKIYEDMFKEAASKRRTTNNK